MSSSRRVLVTGPVERLDAWCDAVREAGWIALPFPLVEIVPLELDPRTAIGDRVIELVCVTSSNALPFVERASSMLRGARGAAVGAHTAARLRELGFAFALEPTASADELTASIATLPRWSVLWPRGDRSDELARVLRSRGHEVVDPIVYSTRDLALGDAPPFDAAFFASPSAVAAWSAAGRPSPRVAIAIGPTTSDALLDDPALEPSEVLVLAEPTPAALAFQLAHLD